MPNARSIRIYKQLRKTNPLAAHQYLDGAEEREKINAESAEFYPIKVEASKVAH